MNKLIISLLFLLVLSGCTNRTESPITVTAMTVSTPSATFIPTTTPVPTAIPGLLVRAPGETIQWIEASQEKEDSEEMQSSTSSGTWQSPTTTKPRVPAEAAAVNSDLRKLAETMHSQARLMGIPVAKMGFVEYSQDDQYRAAVEARAANGNILWAIQRSSDGTFGLTEQPVIMEFRDGAYHLVEMEYLEIPNSTDAVILGGQGSDGTLWTAFRQPVTLPDGSQISALYYDMQVIREENGELVPGDWKFNPAVGLGKFGVIEGQAQRINEKFEVEALGFSADEIIQEGENLIFQLGGLPVAVVDKNGKVTQLSLEKAVFPQGIDPVKSIEKYAGPVEKDQGKILGLNEFGWAVTEFKDGQWVPFERELMVFGGGGMEDIQIKAEDLPEEMMRPLTPEEIHSIPLKQLFNPRGELWGGGDYLGMNLPTTKAGYLQTGYLDDWDTYMKFYSGYALGAVDAYIEGVDGVWLLVEIPYKTQRQVVAYLVPYQAGYFNDLYTYREVGPDGKEGVGSSMLEGKSILYKDLCVQLKAGRGLRGRQVLFARGIYLFSDPEIRRQENELLKALEEGRGIESNRGITITHLWLPEGFNTK